MRRIGPFLRQRDEYVRCPSVSLDYQDYQDYEAEFAGLPGKYASPHGRLLLAWQGDNVVGCAALRQVDQASEMKRVYVRPAARGTQLGRCLVERILLEAKAAGYIRICLDVLPEFTAALQIYLSFGFTDAQPVSFNPVPGTRFLGLDLLAHQAAAPAWLPVFCGHRWGNRSATKGIASHAYSTGAGGTFYMEVYAPKAGWRRATADAPP